MEQNKEKNICKEIKNIDSFEKNNCFTNKTKAKENNLSFEIKNKKISVCQIKVDNYFITDKNTKKCDFAFYAKQKNKEKFFFVELKRPNKSSKINDAVEQITKTIDFFLEKKILNQEENFEGIIILNSIPKTLKQNKFKENFSKKYNNNLFFKSKKYEIKNL
jgi:hypothetical protein